MEIRNLSLQHKIFFDSKNGKKQASRLLFIFFHFQTSLIGFSAESIKCNTSV